MLFEVNYRRISEGKIIIDASSMTHAQKLASVELSCGTAPVQRSENSFAITVLEKEDSHHGS